MNAEMPSGVPHPFARRSLAGSAAVALLVALLFLPGAAFGGTLTGAAASAPSPSALGAPAAHSAGLSGGPSQLSTQSSLVAHGIALSSLVPLRADPALLTTSPAALRAAAGLPALAPHPSGANPSVSNFAIGSTDCSSAYGLSTIGGNPNDLVQSISNEFGLWNGTWPVPVSGPPTSYAPFNNATPCSASIGPTNSFVESNFTETHGLAEIGISTNGGSSWTDSWLGQNASWKPVTHGNFDVRFNSTLNASLPIGDGAVASNASGTGLVVATTFEGTCIPLWEAYAEINPASGIPCGSANLNNTSTGFAVAYSTHLSGSSVTWSTPAQLFKQSALVYLSGCDAFGEHNVTENPTVAIDPATGTIVVSWDDVQIWWDTSTCQLTGDAFDIYHAQSTDGGRTWSAPKVISSSSIYPQFAVGPGPSHSIYEVDLDYGNFTSSDPNPFIQVYKSSNDGTSFGAPTQVISGGVDRVPSRAPGTNLATVGPYQELQVYFYGANPPAIAVDNWTDSHSGNVYVAWGDNLTGSSAGYPGIALSVSTNGGSSWSSPYYLHDPTHTWTYWDPSLTVDPSGTAWVSFWAANVNTADVREMAAVSTNGGGTWSAAFPIANQETFAGTSTPTALPTLGPHFGLVGTTNGTYATWTDGRFSNDTTTYYTAVYGSHLFAAGVGVSSTNASDATTALEINASDTTYGKTTSLVATSTTPAPAVWAVGANHTVVVPNSIPFNDSYLDQFTGFSGAATGSNTMISFNSTGSAVLYADYAPEKAAGVNGTFFPYNPSSLLTINGANVPLTAEVNDPIVATYHLTLPAGRYSYSASAGDRWTDISGGSVLTTAGQETTLNIQLEKLNGTLSIQVSLPGGTTLNQTRVTVNGTVVTASGGAYVLPEPWGYYFINASNPTTTWSNSTTPVYVSPQATTAVPIPLGGGWIDVNVLTTPVKTNDIAITYNGVSSGITEINPGDYNISCGNANSGCAGGTYVVNISEPGYNSSTDSVQVVPGSSRVVQVVLTNQAYVVGQVTPIGVVTNLSTDKLAVEIENLTAGIIHYATSIDPTTGLFNVSVLSGIGYKLVATASGYDQITQTIAPIPAGASSSVISVAFTAIVKNMTKNCTQTGTCKNNSGNGSTTSSSGITGTDLIIIVAIIALVAIVALVLLLRRRPASPAAAYEPAATDGGDTYGAPPPAPPAASPPDWSESPPPGGSN